MNKKMSNKNKNLKSSVFSHNLQKRTNKNHMKKKKPNRLVEHLVIFLFICPNNRCSINPAEVFVY